MEKKRKSKKMRKPGFHALVWKEEGLYVSQCLEIELASQGRTKKEALANLEEALELFLEEENTSNLNGLFLDKAELHRITINRHLYA